jgi:hypothetical protein
MKKVLLTILALGLVGCGGSGGSSAPGTVTTPVDTNNYYRVKFTGAFAYVGCLVTIDQGLPTESHINLASSQIELTGIAPDLVDYKLYPTSAPVTSENIVLSCYKYDHDPIQIKVEIFNGNTLLDTKFLNAYGENVVVSGGL